MTGTEKEFITFAIVTRGTKLAQEKVNPEITHEADAPYADYQADEMRGFFLSGLVARIKKVIKSSSRGASAPHWSRAVRYRRLDFPILS